MATAYDRNIGAVKLQHYLRKKDKIKLWFVCKVRHILCVPVRASCLHPNEPVPFYPRRRCVTTVYRGAHSKIHLCTASERAQGGDGTAALTWYHGTLYSYATNIAKKNNNNNK